MQSANFSSIFLIIIFQDISKIDVTSNYKAATKFFKQSFVSSKKDVILHKQNRNEFRTK